MKNFNRFMYNKTLHHGRKRFFRYCLKYFSSAEILQRHANYQFKMNDKQMIKMPKKCETVKFKNREKKIKSQFMIYADFY